MGTTAKNRGNPAGRGSEKTYTRTSSLGVGGDKEQRIAKIHQGPSEDGGKEFSEGVGDINQYQEKVWGEWSREKTPTPKKNNTTPKRGGGELLNMEGVRGRSFGKKG